MKTTQTIQRLAALAALCSIAILGGCEKLSPTESVPTYLHVQPFGLTTNYATQGTARHKIVDAWLTADGQEFGGYEVPTRVPYYFGPEGGAVEGPRTVLVQAGILLNGQNSRRTVYPFFSPDTFDIIARANGDDTLRPVVRYRLNTRFAQMEDFDGAGVTYDDASGTARTTITTGNDAFEGQSGKVVLDAAHEYMVLAARAATVLPSNKGAVFFELHYRTTVEMTIAVSLESSSGQSIVPHLTLYPSEEWNKVYVDLTGTVATLPVGGTARVLLTAQHDDTKAESVVELDNLKLVY